MEPFKNQPLTDYKYEKNVQAQKEALQEVKKQLGKSYPNIINGEEVISEKKTVSKNPAFPDQVIGEFQKSGQQDAEKAIQSAAAAFEEWKKVPATERANILLKASEEMKRRRLEINAWMTYEAGKNYVESDADTAEAIDFMEFYAREAIRYAQDQPLTPYEPEKNRYFYIPLGAGVCIPPWNFPYAIMVGISAASIAAGNTVVLKPSSDTPMMAWLFQEIMHKAGLPKGVLNYLVASGAQAGDYLVEHPKTRFITFTGSKEVGLRINELAAKKHPDQKWIKRVIVEMGGKDTIVVDSEADIDDAVKGVVESAYGFQGQKCSACSRAVVDAAIYDEFVEKLKVETEKLVIGDPSEDYPVGPVINEAAQNSIMSYVKIGNEEGRLLTGGYTIDDLPGFYIKPTVFVDVDPRARISQEEIFGPVLTVIKAKDYDEALDIANNTEYGLTGAVYSKNREKLDRATHEFHVGNLYFNRKCTRAMVDVHPFGGFNMSGTDSKAGSRDYLALLMQGKSVSEQITDITK